VLKTRDYDVTHQDTENNLWKNTKEKANSKAGNNPHSKTGHKIFWIRNLTSVNTYTRLWRK